jgi:hypothetical protein
LTACGNGDQSKCPRRSNKTWEKLISFHGKTVLIFVLLLVSPWNCTSTLRQEKSEGSFYKQIRGEYVYHSNEVRIEYEHPGQLDKFAKAIQPTPFTCAINKIVLGEGCTSACVSLEEFLNGLRKRIQFFLDMPPSRIKIRIKLHEDLKEMWVAYARDSGEYSRYNKAPAFYDPRTETIHLQTENLSIEILAHEIAHAVIDHYFFIQIPRGLGELLSQHVEKEIAKEGFMICISLKNEQIHPN